MKSFFTTIGLASFLASAFVAHAESVYVHAAKTQLKEAPQMAASNIAEITRGEELSVIKKEAVWFQVKTQNGKTGWVSRLSVNANKPVGKAELSKDLETASLEKSSRSRPKGNTDTVASTRAVLASGDRKRGLQEVYQSDFETVEQMEKSKLKSEDVEKFIKSGSLNK